jgi:thiol:disulfide interchange protein
VRHALRCVTRGRRPLLATLFIALAVAATAAAQMPRVQRAELRLAAAASAFAPGTAARLVAIADVEPGWHLQAHVPTFDYLIPTVLTVEAPPGWPAATVEYPQPEMYRFGFAEEELAVYQGRVRFFVDQPVPADAVGEVTLRATLRYQACDDKQCLPPVERTAEVTVAIGPGGEAIDPELFAADLAVPPAVEAAVPGAVAGPSAAPAPPAAAPGLLGMLLLGIVGGLILNAMPCVLPILSLKVFGLVRSAGQGQRHVRTGALATAAGILVSFWALAGAAIAAKTAGSAVGWGVQFQRPGFVAFLAVVVLLFTLNLWGLFEIQLPGRLVAAAGEGSSQEGLAGHFASGLFATLMATPCSAPFLGTAVGFALAQQAAQVLAIFTAIAVGMALPYLLLAVAPALARHFPRPGAWMETLKGVMGFLLAGALVWLLYVLANQVAPEALALVEGALLAVALLVWLAARAAPGSPGRRTWFAIALVAAVGTIVLAGRSAATDARPASLASDPGGIAWRPWDAAEAERLAAAGTPVFLDITADWCVTCKVNERLILETPEVRGALAERGVVPMKADWTKRDDQIAGFLAGHGRYGIPFYMLYRPGQQPHIYPELLTREIVLRELEALPLAR